MMTKPRVSVSNRIRELGDDEECNQLLRTIPVHRAELLGPLFSQDQVNEFRGWPLRWAGQTIELATRLELCRPGANGGNPLNPGPYLSFLDELPEELAVPRRDRQALEAVMRTPAPAIAKKWVYFERKDFFLNEEAVRCIAEVAALEQHRRSGVEPEQVKWARSLGEYHASFINAATWRTLRLLQARNFPVTDAHTELTAPASQNVAIGEFDFATARHLIDLKCSMQPGFEPRWQLQLLMYWRMGLHPGNPGETLPRKRFEQFTELGVINPLRGHYLFIRVDEIPAAVIEYLDDVVLGFEHIAAAERSMPPPQQSFPVQRGGFAWVRMPGEIGSDLDALLPHEVVLEAFTTKSDEDAAKAVALVQSALIEVRETVPQAAVPATGAVRGTGLRMLKKLYDLALSFDASVLANGTCTVEDAKAAELAARAQQLYLRPITLLRDWPHSPRPN